MDQLPSTAGKRLDGWKAIAAYFNRDRSTVMRWAQERQLPVYRLPGGKQGSVFALEHELAEWAMRLKDGGNLEAAIVNPPLDVPQIAPAPTSMSWASAPRRWRLLIAGIALVLVAGGIAFFIRSERVERQRATSLAMPTDPAVSADYVAARDSWARRTPRDLARSIRLYRQVIARDPDFAPAYAGLAEAWLIYREYGEVGDAAAYGAAQIAALRALSLSPNLPAGHRALGFIRYWRDSDAQSAVQAFQRAIELDDRDALTHFWFANVLADVGAHDAARREYDRARLLSPGSHVIDIEAACAEWQAGRDDVALARLAPLARRYPGDATVHNCLAWLHISHGDIVAFAQAYAAMARARNEPALLKRSATLSEALAKDSATAHRVLIADLRREIASGDRRSHEAPAFYASSMGERALLIAILRDARGAGEQWYSRTITSRIAERWPEDREVQALLKVLRPEDIPLPRV